MGITNPEYFFSKLTQRVELTLLLWEGSFGQYNSVITECLLGAQQCEWSKHQIH